MNRRAFLVTTAGCRLVEAQDVVTQPVVAEVPLQLISPVAHDGHRGLGVLRKPPGTGPFPALIYLHGGITTVPLASLKAGATNGANPSRFLAAGYVVVVPTYRSRDIDPQSPVSLDDVVAVVEYVRALPYVHKQSIVIFGCSGGGDLALQVPARTKVSAIVAEEPASMVTAGMFDNRVPKKGERYTPEDSFFMMDDPKRHYTPEFQKILRAKVARIDCPILIIQGDAERRELPINQFNAQVLLPELHAAKKTVAVRAGALLLRRQRRTAPKRQTHSCPCAAGGIRGIQRDGLVLQEVPSIDAATYRPSPADACTGAHILVTLHAVPRPHATGMISPHVTNRLGR
jgi:acetyl esterase/lipase